MGMDKRKFSLEGNFPWVEDFQAQRGCVLVLGESLNIPPAKPEKK